MKLDERPLRLKRSDSPVDETFIPDEALEGKRVLFVSYNGMLDPLGQSQVIPYLRELGRKGVEFTLLSFERAGAFEAQGQRQCQQLRAELATHKINWHWLPYHQTPSVPATMYDVMMGVRYAKTLVKRNGIEMVHARSHIPATIALALKRHFGLKMIFDIRGLLAEEYVDAQHWRKGSIAYRLTKLMERRALKAADGVVTLTERIWPFIKQSDGLLNRSIIHEVIPCCADLQLFKFDPEQRATRRAELGLADRFTIVYSGSIDGWYLTEKMADFFCQALREQPLAHLLWLTPSGHDRVRGLMAERGIKGKSYTVKSVSSRDVPSYLSASDAGLAFIKPCFSKFASSPTKNAEYLACGLPLIINAGIGDSDALITQEKAGALIDDFASAEYSRAFARIDELVHDPENTRRRMRAVAERLFDLQGIGLERYARLYQQILAAS